MPPIDRPRLLDLGCAAGGCTAGYQRAGWWVAGVDVRPQPHYCGDAFEQADALADFRRLVEQFKPHAIHASMPCQRWSSVTPMEHRAKYPDLVTPMRELLQAWAIATGGVYVMENVKRSILVAPVLICGGAVGLPIKRHRWLESNRVLLTAGCQCGIQTPRFPTQHATRGTYLARVVHLNGSTGGKGGVALRREAMGIEWMTGAELAQAIPPVMIEPIGYQLR